MEVLSIEKHEPFMGQRSTLNKKGPGQIMYEKRSSSVMLATQLSNGSSQRSLASAIELHGSGRKSLSDTVMAEQSGNVSLGKQFQNEEEYSPAAKMGKSSEDEPYFPQVTLRVSLSHVC